MWIVEGEDLVIDNRHVITTSELGDRPGFSFNQELAKKMGWIVWSSELDAYQLGPNIEQEFTQDAIPTLGTFTTDMFKDGQLAFWTIHHGLMELSIFCNWRLLNDNKAFEAVVGNPFSSLFVYSDIGESGVHVLCMYACMYVCMSVCLYVCMSVCLYVCMSVCMYVCLSVCLSVCLYVCLSVCLSVCMCVWCVRACVRACMHACMYSTAQK